MRPRKDDYSKMRDSVESGVLYGIRHFYKHRSDGPDEETLLLLSNAVEDAVMNQICEDWVFDREEEGDE